MVKREAKTASRRATIRGKKKVKALSLPPMPGTHKFLWALLLSCLVILLSVSLFLFYFRIQGYCENIRHYQDVKVALSSPGYLSPGDTEDILVTVLNERPDTASITVTLSYQGNSMCLTEAGKRHIVRFESLPSQGRATDQIQVQFPLCIQRLSLRNYPGYQADFKVWLAVNDQPPQDLGTFSLPVMAVPMSKTLGDISWSLLGGLALFSGKQLWDWLKQAEQSATGAKRSARKGR